MIRSAVACCAILAATSPLALADWPLFRGDALMTGTGSAKLPDKLEVKWEFKAGDAVEGAPAIVGGVAYVASFDKHLYALDLATGKQKWKVKIGATKAPAAPDRANSAIPRWLRWKGAPISSSGTEVQ